MQINEIKKNFSQKKTQELFDPKKIMKKSCLADISKVLELDDIETILQRYNSGKCNSCERINCWIYRGADQVYIYYIVISSTRDGGVTLIHHNSLLVFHLPHQNGYLSLF